MPSTYGGCLVADTKGALPLAGQVALITGGGTGIGAALAEQLVVEGVEVVLTGRREKVLAATAQRLAELASNAKIHTMAGDITEWATCEHWVTTTLALCGKMDIVVNNAGACGKLALMQEVPEADIHTMVDTNLKGPIFLTQAALTHAFVPQQGGTLLNINSIAGKQPFPYWAVYSATKAGFKALAEAVQDEQRANNIRVINLFPAAVATPLWEPIDAAYVPEEDGMLKPQEVAEAALLALRQAPGTLISEITLSALQPAR